MAQKSRPHFGKQRMGHCYPAKSLDDYGMADRVGGEYSVANVGAIISNGICLASRNVVLAA